MSARRRPGAGRGTTALVRAETARGAWAVPIAATRGVVPAEGLTPLPAPAPGVAGVLDHERRALAVLASFGADGEHVVVLEAGGLRFGLLVRRVTGVVHADPGEIEAAPAGQAEPLVTGVLRRPGEEALVLDPEILRRRLP